MLSRLRGAHLLSHMVVAVVVVLVVGGGWAVAMSNTGTIRACANKKTGALRVASKCKRQSERSVSWNTRGRTGARGPAGARGATGGQGPIGPQGPQGPGAVSFVTTVPPDLNLHTVRTIDGLSIIADCSGTAIDVGIDTTPATATLQASGTDSVASTLGAVDVNGASTFNTPGGSRSDVDVIARNTAVAGGFDRFDIHGEVGATASDTCSVWGMITRSS